MVSAFIKEVLLYIASYVGILVIAYMLLAWMMSGLLGPYIRVKTSRGKYVLVKIKTITQDYYRHGKLDKGFLVFKDMMKDERRIRVPSSMKAIYRSMGVNIIDVDDEKNAVNTIDYSAVMGFDAAKYNDLYLRALYKPSLFDKKEKILLALVVVIAIVVAIEAFLLFDLSSKIAALGQISAPTIVTTGGP